MKAIRIKLYALYLLLALLIAATSVLGWAVSKQPEEAIQLTSEVADQCIAGGGCLLITQQAFQALTSHIQALQTAGQCGTGI